MTELKFRVYNQKDKKYSSEIFESDIDESAVVFQGSPKFNGIEAHSIVNTMDMNVPEGLKFLFELFTGEHDLDGVDMFAGDIIKCPKGRNDVIEFKNVGFWLKHRNVTLHHFLYTLRSEVEVIGNIHMNPELDKL